MPTNHSKVDANWFKPVGIMDDYSDGGRYLAWQAWHLATSMLVGENESFTHGAPVSMKWLWPMLTWLPKESGKKCQKTAISQDWFAVNCQKMAMAITRS